MSLPGAPPLRRAREQPPVSFGVQLVVRHATRIVFPLPQKGGAHGAPAKERRGV